METITIVKSFMKEKILKIDFQNFCISWNVSKSISWTFLGSLHNKTIVKYAFHETVWKKNFTVYSRFYAFISVSDKIVQQRSIGKEKNSNLNVLIRFWLQSFESDGLGRCKKGARPPPLNFEQQNFFAISIKR